PYAPPHRPLHSLPSRSSPPPTSTLFPYTTLFRSHRQKESPFCLPGRPFLLPAQAVIHHFYKHPLIYTGQFCLLYLYRDYLLSSRSEEHTSELQSRFDLVCRLLLEKKKYYPRDKRI